MFSVNQGRADALFGRVILGIEEGKVGGEKNDSWETHCMWPFYSMELEAEMDAMDAKGQGFVNDRV